MITIGINGNEANLFHRVGVGQYAYELLLHLSKIQEETEVKFQIYLKSSPLSDMPQETPRWQYKVFGPQKQWTLIGLQNRLIQEHMRGTIPDIFFTPSHYAPLYIPTKSVISIMDMSFETLPEFFKKKDLYQLKYWTKLCASKAKKIITISRFSKNEIIRIYKIPIDRVEVTLLGYDSERFNEKVQSRVPKIKSVLEKYKIKRPYIVFLGTLQPRKNLNRLIEAFSQLASDKLQLVIVGMKNEGRGGWMYQQFFDKVKELKLEDRVVFTEYAPDEEVPYLFAGSEAYILPSLYEGFGIPPIEAMASGVPVVVSKVSSLPEVCGQAAAYIENPTEIDSIKQTLESVLSLAPSEKTKIIKIGLDWVKRYNWEETARKTLEILTMVANSK